MLLAALCLAILAGMFLARKMIVPIQALRAGAARIGSGDLSQRISIKTGDELETLADHAVIAPDRVPPRLTTLLQKAAYLRSRGTVAVALLTARVPRHLLTPLHSLPSNATASNKPPIYHSILLQQRSCAVSAGSTSSRYLRE